MKTQKINQLLLNILKSKSTETLEIEVIALNSLSPEECQYFIDKAIEQKVSAFIYYHLQALSPSSIPPIILNSLKEKMLLVKVRSSI